MKLNKLIKNKKGIAPIVMGYLIIFLILLAILFGCTLEANPLNTLGIGTNYVEVDKECIDTEQCQIETENQDAKCIDSVCSIPIERNTREVYEG